MQKLQKAEQVSMTKLYWRPYNFIVWYVISAFISATLCGWRRCFVADQLWFMTHIREAEVPLISEVTPYSFRCTLGRNIPEKHYKYAARNISQQCPFLQCETGVCASVRFLKKVRVMQSCHDINRDSKWNCASYLRNIIRQQRVELFMCEIAYATPPSGIVIRPHLRDIQFDFLSQQNKRYKRLTAIVYIHSNELYSVYKANSCYSTNLSNCCIRLHWTNASHLIISSPNLSLRQSKAVDLIWFVLLTN